MMTLVKALRPLETEIPYQPHLTKHRKSFWKGSYSTLASESFIPPNPKPWMSFVAFSSRPCLHHQLGSRALVDGTRLFNPQTLLRTQGCGRFRCLLLTQTDSRRKGVNVHLPKRGLFLLINLKVKVTINLHSPFKGEDFEEFEGVEAV